VKQAGNSRLAYLQFGDGPVTYGDANFRRIVRNTILWAASP
jgi:type 1 glutamine amidotransferase